MYVRFIFLFVPESHIVKYVIDVIMELYREKW